LWRYGNCDTAQAKIPGSAAGLRGIVDASLAPRQAQILDGELPEDPTAFANRLNRLVLRG
jgi:molecular chaperone HtpG